MKDPVASFLLRYLISPCGLLGPLVSRAFTVPVNSYFEIFRREYM